MKVACNKCLQEHLKTVDLVCSCSCHKVFNKNIDKTLRRLMRESLKDLMREIILETYIDKHMDIKDLMSKRKSNVPQNITIDWDALKKFLEEKGGNGNIGNIGKS